MCICNGTGNIITESKGHAVIHPCPDSNCSFDKDKADREFKEWQRKGLEFYGAEAV